MPVCRIAVCDACDTDRETLLTAIRNSFRTIPVPFAIRDFCTAAALQAAMETENFTVLFLNMRVGASSGIDIARQIRQRGHACQLIFIARDPELAWESYSVNALHYLRLPVTQDDLLEVWRRCFTRRTRNEHGITLVADRKPQRLMLKNILFAEANNKHCLIHTCDGVLTTRMPIDQLAVLLEYPAFCRCHRGYIVNLRHVARMDCDFHMNNGAVVYVRRSDMTIIRKRFEQFQAEAVDD